MCTSNETMPPNNLIGIIGPGRGYDQQKVNRISKSISKIIVDKNYLPFITPTENSTPEIFGFVFKEQYPKLNLWGINYPDPDPDEFPDHNLNKDLCTHSIDCKIWENQPKYFIKSVKHLIVFGLCTGCVWEIALTKFYWKHNYGKIYIIKELEKDLMPKRLETKLKIEYVNDVDKFDFHF